MSKNLSEKTCGECKHYTECNWVTPDVIADNCEDFELKIITNGDKIRQMSNEDLADRFGIHAMCDFCPAESAACQKGNANIKNCRQAWLDYLNAPAEREGNNDTDR